MEENLLGQQVPIAILASMLIEWLKAQSWFPLADFDAPKLNRAFSVVMAVATGIGIHMTFDAQAANGTLVISGLNAASMLHAGWSAVQQFAMQHFVYWTAVQPNRGQASGPANLPAGKVDVASTPAGTVTGGKP